MARVRHKCFISYHHADQVEVDDFIHTFDQERRIFISRGLGSEMAGDIINSDNPDYVMNRIRKLYLIDSTVTLVLLGRCTWSRRYVDWEIQSSLRNGETVTANGLLGIKLPSYRESSDYPDRLSRNLKQSDAQADCYARVMGYPDRSDTLALENKIEAAFNRRFTHTKWIYNPRERFKNNRQC